MITMVCMGGMMMTSCGVQDKPIDVAAEQATRQEIMAACEYSIGESFNNVRFEVSRKGIEALSEFVDELDAAALQSRIDSMVVSLIANAKPMLFDDMSYNVRKVVYNCLYERFGLDEEEAKATAGFLLLNAYDVLNGKKITFNGGAATESAIDEGFVIESKHQDGKSTTITINFVNPYNGVRMFVARAAKITPVCVQMPETIKVAIKTKNDVEMQFEGSLKTNGTEGYISFVKDAWQANMNMQAKFEGQTDGIVAEAHQTASKIVYGTMDVESNGVKKINLQLNGLHRGKWENEERFELGKVRDYNVFFDMLNDLVKGLKGGSLENAQLTLNNSITMRGSMSDLAKTLQTIAHMNESYSDNATYDEMLAVTDALNENTNLRLMIPNTSKQTKVSFIPHQEPTEKGYHPYLSLQFADEPQPITLYNRLSDKSRSLYDQIMENAHTLGDDLDKLLKKVQEKYNSVHIL